MNENRRNKMPSHNIDDLFRSSIDPAEERPSASVWDNLEKDLDRHNIISIKRKYSNFKKIAIAMVLLLSSALVYEYQTHNVATKNNNTGNGYVDAVKPGGSQSTGELKNQPAKKSTTVDLNASSQNHAEEQVTAALAVTAATEKNVLVSPETPTATILPSSSLPGAMQQIGKAPLKDFMAAAPVTGQQKKTNLFQLPGLPVNSIKTSRPATANLAEPGNTYLADHMVDNSEPVIVAKDPSSIEPAKFAVVNTGWPDVSVNTDNYSQSLAFKRIEAAAAKKSAQTIRLSEKQHAFSLSLIFSPDFTSRVTKTDWEINHEDNRDEIRKKERYAFSYSFGALGDYKINRHWSIQSGFTVSRETINIQPKFIFARRDDVGDLKYKFNSSWGYSYLSPHTMTLPVFGDSLHAFGSTSSLLYVSVPVSAKYRVSKKKFDYSTSVGIAANILVKDKIQTSLFKGSSKEEAINRDIKGPKPVYYSAVVSMGVSYNINKTFAVTFSPTARVALTSLNKDAPVRSYQQSLGLVAGAQITF